MITNPKPRLTERDHAILFGLARQAGLHSSTYYEELHGKLSRAIIVSLADVQPDLVTLGSFVRYRVNGGRALEHKVRLHPRPGQEQETLSVKTLRGLALVGMQEGQMFMTSQSEEMQEAIEIEMVLFQPEADGMPDRSTFEKEL